VGVGLGPRGLSGSPGGSVPSGVVGALGAGAGVAGRSPTGPWMVGNHPLGAGGSGMTPSWGVASAVRSRARCSMGFPSGFATLGRAGRAVTANRMASKSLRR
jgi:hypothetical protein